MSLKNLTRSILLAALAAACAASALAETTADLSPPPIKTAATHAARDSQATSSGMTQSDLIGELLGIAGSKSTEEAGSPSAVENPGSAATARSWGGPVSRLALQTGRRPAPQASSQIGPQNGNGSLGAMFGRLIRIDVDTNTVDIQFEGSRQTTVGSKFSVEHDYAFTTEYLGKIEVIYLAGGNRAIAKPVDKTDITKMGKGDRVGGRIVPNPKGTSAGGTNQSAASGTSPPAGAAAGHAPRADGKSCPAPSCVKPPTRKLPQPPDAAIPYAPDKDGVLEEPAPTPEKTRPTPKLGPPVASNPTRLAPRDKWNGPLARSWGIRVNRNSPATVLVTRHSPPAPATAAWRSQSLWCAVKPKSVEFPGPTQTAALPSRPTSLPAIMLFESE